MGREEELKQLRAACIGGADEPVVRVLTGMGGVGKTSLARAYAQRHRPDYGVVWWVRAEDPAAIDREFRALLELLDPYRAHEFQDAVGRVHAVLAKQSKPWLLVLDNVTDPAAATRLMPAAGTGLVLITSQSTHWPEDKLLRVDQLSFETAIELLVTLSQDDDRKTAKALAKELDRLPLALVQAGSFARAHAVGLATYLELYQKNRAELHAEPHLTDDYPYTVATTWQMAIDSLPRTARVLLNLLCCYAPDAIPVELLLSQAQEVELPEELADEIRPLLENELTRYRALGELLGYSLITTDRRGATTVNMHRLVQAVSHDQLMADRLGIEWNEAAHSLLNAVLPDWQLVNAEALTRWNALHTHVLALLEHLPQEAPRALNRRHDLAKWTGEAGDPAAARDLYTDLVRIRERVHGPEHPYTLITRHELARWTGIAGDPAAARDLYTDLVRIRERILGPEHPGTLSTRHELAYWTKQAGDPTAAHDQLAELLPIRERILGPEHPDTLTTRHNLAYWTGETGDPTGARDQLAELLPIRERILGLEHPGTLNTRHELAYWTGEAGDATGARDRFAKLLPIRERILITDHPDTLRTRHNLAYWIGETGDPTGARDQLAELLPIRERILGPEHPDTLTTRRNLAYWTKKAQEDKAE